MKCLICLSVVFCALSTSLNCQKIYQDEKSVTAIGVNVTAIFTMEECGPVLSLDFGVELQPYHHVLLSNSTSVYKCINQGGSKYFRIPFDYFPEQIRGDMVMSVGWMLEKWSINKFDLRRGMVISKAGTIDVQIVQQGVALIKSK